MSPLKQEKLIQELKTAADAVVASFRTVSLSSLHTNSTPGRWSPAQILRHLTLVERGIHSMLENALRKDGFGVPLFKRILPIHLLVRSRIRKVESPDVVRPGEVDADCDQLIDEYLAARGDLVHFLNTNREMWERMTFKHPFFGIMSISQTIRFIAAHEMRHLQQLKEEITRERAAG